MAIHRLIPPRLQRQRLHHRRRGRYDVAFHDIKLDVTVTKRAAEVDEWVRETLDETRGSPVAVIVGLDIEWHPCNPPVENPVATLQLCMGSRCLIFQLLHADYIPGSLFTFLSSPGFAFAGVGVEDDARKLFRDHGLVVGNCVELGPLASSLLGPAHGFTRMGLKRLASEIIGRRMEKPKEVTLSDWDAENLTFKQIEYGAIDALVSSMIGFTLFAMIYHARC